MISFNLKNEKCRLRNDKKWPWIAGLNHSTRSFLLLLQILTTDNYGVWNGQLIKMNISSSRDDNLINTCLFIKFSGCIICKIMVISILGFALLYITFSKVLNTESTLFGINYCVKAVRMFSPKLNFLVCHFLMELKKPPHWESIHAVLGRGVLLFLSSTSRASGKIRKKETWNLTIHLRQQKLWS